MKIKHKKVAASGIAVALAGVLGVGALLQTSVSVQASSAMMPGIEEIVSEASADKPFKILEIVDNTQDAEIGYYVSGQEPYIKLYSYTYKYKDENNTEQEETIHFQTLEEGLEKLPSDTLRKEFAQNVKIDDDDGNISGEGTGIKNIQSICYQDGSTGDAGDYPLSYSPYVEQYFISSDEEKSGNWTRIDFKDAKTDKSRTDTVKINGEYRENSAGTGDYTKQEQTYYPIREGSDDKSQTDKYRENIQNFYYADGGEATAPYFLEFEEVDNATVNAAFDANHNKINGNSILAEYNYEDGEYGYYENVYSDLTQEIVENITDGKYTFPGEKPETNLDSAVRIPNTTNTTSVNARTFSDGTGDFSSINEQNPTDTENNNVNQTDISADNSQTADAFSSGDFSDGVSTDSGIGNDDSVQTQDIDGADLEFDAGTNQDAVADSSQTDVAQATATIENDKIAPIIAYTQKTNGNATKVDDSVGKSKNPKVYYGRTIDQYPYYQYTLISDMEKVKTCAEANQEAVDAGTYAPDAGETSEAREHNITFQDGQYWYWTVDASGTFEKNPISVVTQRQPVSYDDIREIPQDLGYNYYYKVKQAYFCCKTGTESDNDHTYAYYGWYSPSYSDQNNVYIKVSDGDGKVATHYISEAEYKLTPGIGNYDFAPDETKDQESVEVNHMYYHGGYKNNDWFKRHVFHLTEDDKKAKEQFDKFNIEVDTISAKDFNAEYGDSATSTTGIETSEVEPMVSEAGVELVAIENESSDNSDDTDEFQDGTDSSERGENAVSVDVLSDGEEEALTFTDDSENTENTFSAGDVSTAETVGELSEYDLIYINGMVSANAVQAIGNDVAVMINSVKVYNSDELMENLSAFVDAEDEDHHYVNKRVYFFRNTFSTENPSGLINQDFHTNFNSESDGSTFTDSDASKGFEEILKYIESENKYRQIGQTAGVTQTLSDEENLSDNENTFSTNVSDIQLLTNELTQARAIEYIINYKYKRNINRKDHLNVLEIEPAKSDGKLNADQVKKWLNYSGDYTIKSYEACSSHSNNPISNLFDPDGSKIWHNDWNKDNDTSHYIKVTFEEETTLTGFNYLPRNGNSGGSENGKITEFCIYLYGKNGKEIYKENGVFDYTELKSDHSLKEFPFADGKIVSGVKSVKIEILKAGYDKGERDDRVNGNTSTKLASGAYLSFRTPEKTTDVTITVMTASEFVGHVDDINSEYDMIYIGDSLTESKRDITINGVKPMLYTHVGGAVNVNDIHDPDNKSRKLTLMGILDIDTVIVNGKKKMQNTALYNTGENGETTYPGLGSFRGSGNDITKQQYNELLDFVKSGYPVVLADSLVENGRVSTKTVDNSSWYYRFMSEVLSYDNVSTASTVSNTEFSFFANLTKPVIEFTETGRPTEVPRAGQPDSSETGYLAANQENIEYQFTVKNDSDALPANTTYNCQLYFDLNFDGNLSEKEEQGKYIEICDEKGNVLSRKDGVYQLQIGKTYTVSRKIPYDYFKAINWKLQLVSNTNTSVRTSVTGYSKRKKAGEKQEINVLQIIPSGGDANFHTWNLQSDWEDHNSWFYKEMSSVEDFTLKIRTETVTEYVQNQKALKQGSIGEQDSMLYGQDMLILGFGDVYQNIDNTDGAVDNIKTFIENGKSVIFSHDTTSNINWDYEEFDSNPVTADGKEIKDSWLWSNNRKDWGYSLNSMFRSIAGLDRYGITNDMDYSVKDGNTSISNLLKKGNVLNANAANVDFSYMEEMVGDVAYVTNSDRSQSYMQTQGYTNKELHKMAAGSKVNTITKVNDGIITEYPYKLKDGVSQDQTFTVANTHGQYYQLALEKDRDINGVSDGRNDIVVWYCLSGDYYEDSPNDVRNNYYFYSRGNVIYTGVGHRTVTGKDEVDLFVNAIVAAANITAVSPYVDFVKTLDPAAQTEKVRYYATDQTSWVNTDANVLEKDQDFYINLKDYNMISSSLSQDDLDKEDMTVEFRIGNSLEDSVPVNSAIGQMIPYNKNTDAVVLDSSDRLFHLKNRSNDAYKITIPDIEQYLKESDGNYKNHCNLYVKVTSKAALYGEIKENTSVTSIALKQRQLFELD